MKKWFQAKYLTVYCFLVLLAVMFLQGIPKVYNGFVNAAAAYPDTGTVDFSIVENDYNANFSGKYRFITLNGAYQRLMGIRVVNERYKLDNGQLTYIIEEYDTDGIARNTVAFRDALHGLNIPMVYVNTPFKIHRTDKQLPANTADYSNENADRFVNFLRKENVPVLDLRDVMENDGLAHYDMFYKTDHHWKAEAGLWAAGEIADFLSAADSGFHVPDTVLDPSSYHFEVHENIFLGSAGRRVGGMYAGKDDLTVITPVFRTDFSLTAENGTDNREGTFEDVFIVREHLTPGDPLMSNAYATYCGYGFSHAEIQNNTADPDFPCSPKKVLIIRDSFSDVLIPFMSLAYAQLDVIDLRGFSGDLMGYIEESAPDVVMVVYNPGAYEPKNFGMFDFLNAS